MNYETASRTLAEYRQAVADAGKASWLSAQRTLAVNRLNGMVPHVNEVLHDLAPDLPLISATNLSQHRTARALVIKGETILHATVMEQFHIATEVPWIDTESPVLPLVMLDPVILRAAWPLWEMGKYRQAVNDAASSLNQFAQQQLGRRDISDKKLMAEAFSDNPPKPGEPRLRCYRLGRAMESVHSQQEGARLFAMGTFAAIRNPAHHETGDWNPLTAFHHLVALSQVAHYFRDWKVVKFVPPPPDFSKLSASTAKTGP